MIKKILNRQTKSISSASLILAAAYLLSAVLGLFRDRLLAGYFGAGNELDVYYAAFAVPDFVAMILILGAISAAVIPVFSSYLVKSKEEAWKFVSALFNIFLSFLILICVVLAVFAPYFVVLIAPGFSEEKKEMTVLLTRIMFLSPILLGVSNIISGILQVFHRFLVTALAPVLYNLGIIAGIFFFVPRIGLSGLAWGVVLGGCLHLLVQIPAFFHSGFRIKPVFNIRQPGVLETLKLMAPRSLSLGVFQINKIVITAIASTLSSGSIAIFNLANNLSVFLANAVAISLSTAVFPSMSLEFSHNGEEKEFNKKFFKAFRQIIFLTAPISILIFILRAQIVRVILGAGRFDWVDTRLTAACLGIFSLGLLSHGLVFILSKTFYASHNTKIPAAASFATVFLNILLSIAFVWLLKHSAVFFNFISSALRLEGIENISVVGLSMAYSIASIFQFFLLMLFLFKRFKSFRTKEIFQSGHKVLISSLAMVAFTFTARQTLIEYNLVSLQVFWGVFLQLFLSAAAGALSYFGVAFLLKSAELEAIIKWTKSKLEIFQ